MLISARIMKVGLLIFSILAALAGAAIESGDLIRSGLQLNENDIHIYYYSQKVPKGMEITHKNYDEDMSQTDFNSTKRTVFAVHGWHNNYSSQFCEVMQMAYLAKHDVNVFVVDWHAASKLPYLIAYLAIHDVATNLGKLIGTLVQQHGLSLDTTLIVGHSLGAHIAGLTGAALKGQVDTIIGLDPAGPGFAKDDLDGRLDETDGKFVQALHTCPGVVGEDYPVGKADYYANDGIFQPGCPLDPVQSMSCAHGRAYQYFAESLISGTFEAVKCKDYNTYKTGACANNSLSYMGQFDVDKSASGSYFFETNATPPYAKS